MIRVLYVDSLPGFGGAQKSLLEILDHGPQLGIQPAAVIMPKTGPLVDHVLARGVPVGIVPFYGFRLPNPLRYAQTLHHLWSWARHTRAEIIHLNFPYLLDYMWWLKTLTGCPLICHVRTMESPESMTRRRLAWMRRADAVVAVSRAVQRSVVDWGVAPQKVRLIHNAIDLRQFSASNRKGSLRGELGIPDGDALVGTVCRVVHGKGIEDLIDAAVHLIGRVPNTHFVVAGDDGADGQGVNFYRGLAAERGLAERFHFVGFRADVADVMRDLDVFVLASWSEGFGLVVLEAMASGTPVVATAVGGVPELVEDGRTGFLVAPQDADQLARAICRVLAMPPDERASMVEAARSVVGRFSAEDEIWRLRDLYQDVIAHRKAVGVRW